MNTFNYEQIDQYLMGQLQGESLRLFEQQLEGDPDLANEVKERRKSLDVLEDIGDLQLKERIQNIHNRVLDQQPASTSTEKSIGRIRPLYTWLALAASVLLLLAAGMWWSTTPTPDAQQLFAQHYEAYPISFTSRAGENDTKLADASRYYREGAFEKVIGPLESVLADSINTKAKLALGIAELELNHFAKAIQHFDDLINAKDPLYEEQALWFKALTYLKQNDLDNCAQQLKQLDQDRFSFKRQAALDLLEKL
ncbi:MAG: hypothetical protein AAF985_05635 [Bacteroidota bacterium]